MTYDPKIPLKYYRDEKRNIMLNKREWRWFWFKVYPITMFGLIGLIILIAYFAPDIDEWFTKVLNR